MIYSYNMNYTNTLSIILVYGYICIKQSSIILFAKTFTFMLGIFVRGIFVRSLYILYHIFESITVPIFHTGNHQRLGCDIEIQYLSADVVDCKSKCGVSNYSFSYVPC